MSVEDRVSEDTTGARAESELRDVVAVRLPASSGYLSVLRTVTAGLAARLDFTLDEIEDLRIAVDEACGLLVSNPDGSGELECEFELDTDRMDIRVTAPTVDGAEPVRDTFAWNVLAALAGEVDAHTHADRRVTIVLRKRRGVVGHA